MSADLFAAFETPAHPPSQSNQQNRSQAVSQTTQDPFSFLSPVSAPQPQNAFSSQWPPLQQQAPGRPGWGAWPTRQVNQPQNIVSWGDIESLSGFQSATAASVPETIETRDEDDDDTWGDFEVAPTDAPQPPPVIKVPTLPPRTRVTRASTIDLMTNKLVDLDLASSTLEPWQERPSWEKKEKAAPKAAPSAAPKPAKASDPNVLFDADDFELQSDIVEEDDEFGDFETGAASVAVAAPAIVAPPVAPPALSALDLLSSLDSNVTAPPPKRQPPGLLLSGASLNRNTLPYPQAPKSPYGLSFQNRKPEQVRALQVKTPLSPEFPKEITREAKDASPTPVTAWPGIEEEGFGDDWDEFKDVPESKAKPKKPVNAKLTKSTITKPAVASSDWGWSAWCDLEEAQAEANLPATRPPQESAPVGPPPTNIPPPSILLSVFPQLLDLASTSLLKPVNRLPNSIQQCVLNDTATAVFLRGYLALATVAARIISGRKQRWHRDKFLMQGMSISAAAAGGGKTRGMKLTSVDKAQTARDDREAAEVAAVWKQQVGRLRTAVTVVNGARPDETPLRVPELGVTMVVQTAQGVPTAAKACVICGLKREERVAKVDFDVEDSFGEWWIEFWGHRDCRNFWLEHEVKLRQR